MKQRTGQSLFNYIVTFSAFDSLFQEEMENIQETIWFSSFDISKQRQRFPLDWSTNQHIGST